MRRLSSIAVALVTSLMVSVAGAAGQDDDRVRLTVTGSPLMPDAGENVEATVTLAEPADLRLRVVDFDGRTVAELFDGPRRAGPLSRSWRGRDADGERVPNGAYRLVATAAADGSTERAEAWVTVADRAVYRRQPGFITVAVDPGHGGTYDGAVGADGTREADLNLDISLRLARMLEGAGVDVVITRTTDADVNEPPEDRTGDGVIDGTDELAARPDLANLARADLFIAVHNNIAVNGSVGGPSTFFFDERPFAARSARLAGIVQDEMVSSLGGIADGYQPHDHGALIYPYYVLRDYDPPRLKRPTQMPGVLSEGMFLSNERELRFLKRGPVRAAMANAYYDAIAIYLERRGAHVGYQLVSAPAEPVVAGETIDLVIDVRNQGTETMRDWRLPVSVVPAPVRYVGRVPKAPSVGEARIPRLEPGQSRAVEVEVLAPAAAGQWTMLFDARDDDGERAANLGSPMLQVPLTTTDPLPASPAPGSESGVEPVVDGA